MSTAPQVPGLDHRLRAVWQREQTLHRRAGWLTFFRWALVIFLVGMAIDWLFKLPSTGRWVLLVVLGLVALYRAWQAGLRHLRRYDAARTALRVEASQGGMESLLVTAVQFRDAGAPEIGSSAMREKTCLLAEDAAAELRPEQTVSFKGLRRIGLLALIPLLILGGFALYRPAFVGAGIARIFAPWLSVEYPTRTHIELTDSDPIVKEGEAVRLRATISGEIPKTATIILRTGEGKPRERTLTIREGVCTYEAKTVFRSFDYRIAAGDDRTEWHAVEVIAAPRIEKAEVQLSFPEYTQRPAETIEALTLTVPEGTKIRWALTLDRPLSQAGFRPAAGDPQPLNISGDGRSVSMEADANESRAYRFVWVDEEHGFEFSSPRHYLQVAPDQAPAVELTSPAGNLYSTLERDLAFAFRARDDHGIGEAAISYRVNKTAETRVELPTPSPGDTGEQAIDWEYREALPELAVGDTVTFAVEVADRYPPTNGPHRVRSEARRVQFLSREDYLALVAKQKRRLLAQVRAMYREERGVHSLVHALDPASDRFVETCQLEAVRQDLIRERLAGLRGRIDSLMEDLAANNVSNEVERTALTTLGADLQAISDEHIQGAANALRDLAAVSEGAKDPGPAVRAVDQSARELGLVVLQLGFAEASDVMARELHATAQTQASLRQQTIAGGDAALAAEQIRLAGETTRLLAATPVNIESSSKDALIAFKLSRLVNQLVRSRADKQMRQAAGLIPDDPEAAARLQAGVIASLLQAEFRLRLGAEFEALTRARDLFTTQAERHRAPGLTAAQQASLQRDLQLLLLPEFPAVSPRLFDDIAPTPPPVPDLLATAGSAMAASLAELESGDAGAATAHQQEAAVTFERLGRIAADRMKEMTRPARIKSMVSSSTKQSAQLLILEERLLLLLEQAEDAADDERNLGFLAAQNQTLADDIARLGTNIQRWKEGPSADAPLSLTLERAARAVSAATTSLRDNEPDPVIEHHETALDALEEAIELNEALGAVRSAFAGVLETTGAALAPSPLLIEIEEEQAMLSTRTEAAKPEGRPALIIPQKNLIHAVDAVLGSLDPLAHKIESGTVLLFAKEDMDAAAIGLEEDDIEEALDAQSFVIESMQDLRAKIDRVTPEYRYVRELNEFLFRVAPAGPNLRSSLRELPEPVGVRERLGTQATTFGRQLQRLTGEAAYLDNAEALAKALEDGEEDALEDALDELADQSEDLQLLMENLAYLITPPPVGALLPEPTPEVKLIHKALSVAAHHHDLARETRAAPAEKLSTFAKRQEALSKQCEAFVPTDAPPQLATALEHLRAAGKHLQSGQRDAALQAQAEAGNTLRHFILEYVLAFVDVPPPLPPQDPAPDADLSETEGELQLFMPGALTGKRPKGGRLEWQVLGQRDRAALNENFARELPLEYRALLKDYYERLTQ